MTTNTATSATSTTATNNSPAMERLKAATKRLSSVMGRLAKRELTPPVELRAPKLEALLEGEEVAPWLREEYRGLAASGEGVDSLMAVGLVARLWEPTTPVARARLIKSLLGGERVTPVEKQALSWVQSLGRHILASLDHEVAEVAHSVADKIDVLGDMLRQGDPTAPYYLVWLLRCRDDVESAAWLLRSVECTAHTDVALSVLDRIAMVRAAELSLSDVPRDRRLATVAWQQPDAWWGMA